MSGDDAIAYYARMARAERSRPAAMWAGIEAARQERTDCPFGEDEPDLRAGFLRGLNFRCVRRAGPVPSSTWRGTTSAAWSAREE